jgi:hypothetical protein
VQPSDICAKYLLRNGYFSRPTLLLCMLPLRLAQGLSGEINPILLPSAI